MATVVQPNNTRNENVGQHRFNGFGDFDKNDESDKIGKLDEFDDFNKDDNITECDCRRWTDDPSGWELMKYFASPVGTRQSRCSKPADAEYEDFVVHYNTAVAFATCAGVELLVEKGGPECERALQNTINKMRRRLREPLEDDGSLG